MMYNTCGHLKLEFIETYHSGIDRKAIKTDLDMLKYHMLDISNVILDFNA